MGAVKAAVADLATELSFGRIASENTFAGLRCAEADALARVFIAAGERDMARDVILSHSQGDEADSGYWHDRIRRARVKKGFDRAEQLAAKYVADLA